MNFAYLSDVGKKRLTNQDCCCVLKNNANQYFGVVCDGMGGHKAGEFASQLALDYLCESFINQPKFIDENVAKEWLESSINEVNQIILDDSKINHEHAGMGTTVVCCLVIDKYILISHLGDSRAYYYQDENMVCLTRDHTYVNLLVDSGSITQEQANVHPQKHVLMKALGVFNDLSVPVIMKKRENHPILLCSDGLYNCVSEQDMAYILKQDILVEEKVMLLVQVANDHGGYDNISAVLLDVGGEINE